LKSELCQKVTKPDTCENLILAQKVTCQIKDSSSLTFQKRYCWSFWYAFLAL